MVKYCANRAMDAYSNAGTLGKRIAKFYAPSRSWEPYPFYKNIFRF